MTVYRHIMGNNQIQNSANTFSCQISSIHHIFGSSIQFTFKSFQVLSDTLQPPCRVRKNFSNVSSFNSWKLSASYLKHLKKKKRMGARGRKAQKNVNETCSSSRISLLAVQLPSQQVSILPFHPQRACTRLQKSQL